MKRIFAILIFILFATFLPLTAIAQNIEQGDNIVLGKNEVVDKDYFAAGNSVSLEGTVNGDAYLAGGNIVVNGTVNGDLLAAGGNIDIRGTVTGNIRTVGGNVNLSGPVGRNVTLAGGSLNLASNANITGSLAAAGGQITLGNSIGGDVNAATGQLVLSSSTDINGDLTYLSQNKASVSNEATVSGKITQNLPPKETREAGEKAGKGLAALFSFLTLASFILAAIIGTSIIKLLPKLSDNIASYITRKPLSSLGIGFLTVLIVPAVSLLLLITLIGIPIAVFLTFVLLVALYLAKLFVSFVIGDLILKRFRKNTGRVWTFLLGLIIYYLVGLIPILGWLASTVVALIGLGAIVVTKKDYYKNLRAKEII